MDIQTLTNWLKDKYEEEKAKHYGSSRQQTLQEGRLEAMEATLGRIGCFCPRRPWLPDKKNELKYKMPDGYSVDQGGVSSFPIEEHEHLEHPMDINEGSAWNVPSTDSPYPPLLGKN